MHLLLDPAAGGGGGQAAQGGFPELHRHAAAHLAHGVDDLVHGDAAGDARHGHVRHADGVHRADDVALDAGNLHQARHGVAHQAHEVLQGHGHGVADLLAGSGNFRNKGRNLLSYMIFVLSPVFSYGMLWFDRDAYVQYLVEKGTEQTYMDTMVSTAQNWMLPAMIIGVLICAAISGLVGQKLLKKHFEKAGVV